MVAIFVLFTIITFLTVDFFVQRSAARRAGEAGAAVPSSAPVLQPVPVPAVDLTDVPAGVFVGPGHAWATLAPSGVLRIGADRLPANLLGGVERVDLRPAGADVERGEPLAVLSRGDRQVELRSPVAGRVTGVNRQAEEEPSHAADDPYGAGWLVEVVPRRLSTALRRLFVAEEARAWMRRELSRLRELLVTLPSQPAAAAATLPDGGLPANGVAESLSEAEWEVVNERFFALPEAEDEESW
jgi:glycine cleavage system H protein